MTLWLRFAPCLALLLAPGLATAQQPQQNIMILAQARDRCMTTFAVRLTKTAATDEAIYAEAERSCQGLKEQLRAAITAQLPPADAQDVIVQLDTSAKPNFMALLARIRRDRAAAAMPSN